MPPMNLNDIYKPIPYVSEICVSLKRFAEQLARDETNLSPAYQRGSVWTRDQRELFMGHLLQGGEVLPLIFQRQPDQGHAEVVDGKQRCESILAWLEGQIGARLDDGRLVMQREVTGGLGRVDVRIRYINLPWAERVRYYARLNSAGTPHTKEQIAAALAARQN